jgi:hypothetical protein
LVRRWEVSKKYEFLLLGTLFSLILFTKILKIDDAALGILSSTSRIVASLVYAFAPTPFVFYLGAIIEILNGTSFIAMRSIISKLVPPDELGKINSLFGLSEAMVPIIYGPLYSIVYKLTINFLPGTFFIVGGVLTVPSLFIFGYSLPPARPYLTCLFQLAVQRAQTRPGRRLHIIH